MLYEVITICSGIKSLTININVGRGSLYKNMDEANKIAKYISAVAKNFNLPIHIVYTNSNYILGKNVGNSLELKEIIEYFKTSPECSNPFVHNLVLEVASRALLLNGLASDIEEAKLKIETVLISGLALDILAKQILSSYFFIGQAAGSNDCPIQIAFTNHCFLGFMIRQPVFKVCSH